MHALVPKAARHFLSRSVTVVLLALTAAISLRAAEKQFLAGAAASNITPPLGVSVNGNMRDYKARHVHDELHARCIVLDDGEKRLAIVVVDSCMVPREVMDAAKREAAEHTGIPVEQMLVSATHTHSAPASASVFQSDADAEYQRFLSGRIADGIRRAVNNLAPARIGWGVGEVPDQVFNRRWRMKPGTIPPNPFGGTNDLVKMNPPVGSENLIEPAGPTDPQISVVSIQSREGRPIAVLANYSLHYCGGTTGAAISADYFGMFADRIQELLGADRQDPPFVGMMSNGTSGDINNINFRGGQPKQRPYGQMRLVADATAREAFRVYQQIKYHDWVPLGARQTEISLGVRLPSQQEVSEAREIIGRAEGPVMQTPPEIYARETVLLSEYPARVSLILQALRIGDLAIAAIPCEVFVEIGLEIKEKSPFEPTFTISLANGYNGYLPTPEHHKLGGYETWRARSSYLEPEASPKILKELFSLLNELK